MGIPAFGMNPAHPDWPWPTSWEGKQLGPCPSCGTDVRHYLPSIHEGEDTESGCIYVFCHHCDMRGPGFSYRELGEWTGRATPEEVEAQRKAVEAWNALPRHAP